MPRYEFKRDSRAALLDELLKVGFTPDTVKVESLDDVTWVTCAEQDYDAVAQVVAVHDVVLIDARVAEVKERATEDQTFLKAVVAELLSNATFLEMPEVVLKEQQVRNIMATTNRALAKLLGLWAQGGGFLG